MWYKGETMPNGHSKEFNQDMANPLQDLSGTSEHSPDDALFTYADDHIDCLSNELSIPWKPPKRFHSGRSSPTLDSYGISMHTQWPFQQKRNSNTSTQLRNGRRR